MITTKYQLICTALLIFNILLVGCNTSDTTSTATAATTYANVSVEEASAVMEQPGTIVLDVRTPAEIAEGKIDGAMELDYRATNFKDGLAKLDKEKTYLVYCKKGGRSSAACEMMVDMGFEQVINLEGGYTAWVK